MALNLLELTEGKMLLAEIVGEAKGDLIAGTGATSFATVTVGANNKVLRADSGQTAGIEWASVLGTSNQVTVTHNAEDITLSLPQSIAAGSSPTFTGLTLSGLTASRLVSSNGDKALASTDLATWVAGTTNQITVTDDADGTITLSTPQDIHSGASPTFVTLTLVGGNLRLDNAQSVSIKDSEGTYKTILNLSGANNLQLGGQGQVAGSIQIAADVDIKFYPGSTGSWNETVRFTSAGNVGVGVTPETDWSASFDAVQVGATGSFYAYTTTTFPMVGMLSNARATQSSFVSGYKYICADLAADYYMDRGIHYFRVAPTGAADGAITWVAALDMNQSATVVNEGGADRDFRVEASGEANALFVQGSDGKVGIGCTPGAKLDIKSPSAGGTSIRVVEAGSAQLVIDMYEASASSVGNLRLYDGAGAVGTHLRGDDGSYFGGNVGIGVSSLESWHASYTALQLGGNASLWGNTAAGASTLFGLMQNAYYSTGWKYVSTDEASYYYQQSGTHVFRVATSGTADATITWTTAMTIDSAGNLGIGTTSPKDRLHVGASLWGSILMGVGRSIQGADGPYLGFNAYETSTAGVWDTVDANYDGCYFHMRPTAVDSATSLALVFVDQAAGAETEVLRATKAGNLGIGINTPGQLLHLYKATGDVKLKVQSVQANADPSLMLTSPSGEWQIYVDESDGQKLKFYDGSDVNMTITTGGSVGIGTTSPSVEFHIKSNNPQIRLEDDDDNQDWEIRGYNNFVIQDVTSAVARMTISGSDGSVVVGDHGTAATDMLVNVCYGTGSPPAANTTTIGALFIKYIA